MNSPIYTSDRNAVELFRAAYPESNLRTVKIRRFVGPMSLNSYWQDGSRDYFRIMRTDGTPVHTVEQNGTPFDGKNHELSQLPAGNVLAEHSYFGNAQYATLYFNEADLVKMLPPTVELTWGEKVVLAATRGYKPAFRLENAMRLTNIAQSDYDTAKQTLISKRLLNAIGAITNEGRNAIGTTELLYLKRNHS